MNEGAYDYVLKPFRLAEVHRALVRASERLISERAIRRMRDLLSFYDRVLTTADPNMLFHLFGLLSSVALYETGGEEVAVWMKTIDGSKPVARGGKVRALFELDPDTAREDDSLLLVPIVAGGNRVGAVGVYGGGAHRSTERERPALFARLGGEATERAGGWRPTMSGR